MGDFDYLGDVKLGSSIVVKPKKRGTLGRKIGIFIVTASFLSGALYAGAIGFTQLQKNGKSNFAVPAPSESQSSAPQSLPSASIDLNRGNYEVASTVTVPEKVVKTKKKKYTRPNKSVTPTPSATPSETNSTTTASESGSGRGSTPKPTFTLAGVYHTAAPNPWKRR